MKILHIMTDGPAELPQRICEAQSDENEIEIVDVSYDTVIDAISACDKVVSW
jgi:hypothetical protein